MAHESDVIVPEPNRPFVRSFAEEHADGLHARSRRTVPAELPDIVVVQSEAFFDPGVLKGIDYGQYIPNFERLAGKGISGELKTPTLGGGTIRTEFETLTGYPVQAFPSAPFPYYGLAAGWMPTVPRRLEELGYSAQLFHPFKAIAHR
jgi:phosphoglycerol transferase MdoB-like AlkP superfamily enzyme